MKLGTVLRILADYPSEADLKKNDLVTVVGVEDDNDLLVQIEGYGEWWYISKLMEGKNWEVVGE